MYECGGAGEVEEQGGDAGAPVVRGGGGGGGGGKGGEGGGEGGGGKEGVIYIIINYVGMIYNYYLFIYVGMIVMIL